MRAVVYDRTGPARDVLRVVDVECPQPGPGEVRVRVAVSGVNPTDVKTRSGAVPRPIDGFQIPHQDGVGTIDAIGHGVEQGRLGERVWVWFAAAGRRWGTAAEWTVVPEHQAVPLPATVSPELDASLGVPAMTACHCLFADGPLHGGTVLVAGGTGAVGHFAIELARWARARVVSTVSGPEQATLATRAGAQQVVNYKDPDAIAQIRSFAAQIDRVIEVNLGANLPLDLALAGPGTTVVSYASPGEDPILPVRACMTANLTLRFVLLYSVPAQALQSAVGTITSALMDGALSELPVHRFALDDIVAAHEAVESGVRGKVLIDIG
ncbi:MAG: NADPH:quinone reductase [Pseudonocardiaceae bacterium]